MKLSPVRIEEKPAMNTPSAVGMTLVFDAADEYGV